MKQTQIRFKESRLLACMFIILVAVFLCVYGANGQEIIKGQAFELNLSDGWQSSVEIPQGFDVGFQKPMAGGMATFLLNYEIMSEEAGEPPSDTSEMQHQFDVMIKNRYPDATFLESPDPVVKGHIIMNGAYNLTDNGGKVTRRYTYFLSNRTAFVVQCSAPPADWGLALTDFDKMIATLVPNKSDIRMEVVTTDDDAISELKNGLPVLLGSFPPQMSCKFDGTDILAFSDQKQRILDIKLVFQRSDIKGLYDVTKQLFIMIREGKSEAELQSLPAESQRYIPASVEFIKYIGEVWGVGFGYVANCDPPITGFRVSIFDAERNRIGSVSISRKNGTEILSGKADASQPKLIASMYRFE